MTANGNGNGASRLGLYASIFMACAVVMSAFIWVGGIAGEVEQDRMQLGQLSGRVNGLAGEVRQIQISGGADAKNECQQFAKIETQFATVETVLNKVNVDAQREAGAVDLKLFGKTTPSIYYAVLIPHDVLPC